MSALPLDDFAPVSLDELVAEAALLTRVDRKYLVPAREATRIIAPFAERSRVLQIAGRREFAYDSVYFDTPDHLSYRLTAQSRRRRFKLRTRSYLDTGAAFLECKTKSGRGGTVKDRMPYDPADRERLTPAGRAYLRALLDEYGHDPRIVSELRPSLVSRYRRATLLLACGSRATIDTRLQWARCEERPLPGGDGAVGRGAAEVSLPGHVVIESKSAGRPSALDRALWRAGHRPSGISKFGVGTAALHPHLHLPRNKWARTLSGPFGQHALIGRHRSPGPAFASPTPTFASPTTTAQELS